MPSDPRRDLLAASQRLASRAGSPGRLLLAHPARGTLRAVELFASAAKGTETALRDELLELGFAGVRADRGGVHFQGDRREAYRACFWSRIAVRILEPVASFDCPSEDALYAGAHACDLSEVLTPTQSLLVGAACRSSQLTHTQYIAQKTKDAIVDRQRETFGSRSNVERDDPDVQLFVHLVRDRATLYLDHATAPLHQRGYRKSVGDAPLKETLAAAVLRLTGFSVGSPCLDPMCGSGTLLIEAALWASGRAPGSFRERFGFERWASYDDGDRRFLAELRGAARELSRAETPPMLGCDVDAEVLSLARENAQRAGVRLDLREARVASARPESARGVLVSNPPYGERLARSPDLPRELSRLVDRFPDAHVGLLMSETQPLGRTRRKPRLHELLNGDIPCSLRTFAPIDRRRDVA